MKHPLISFLVLAILAGISLVTPTLAVTIEWVGVGNPGNAADPSTGYGSVGYAYQIAKNETTISQYAEFLNAVAKTDTYGLYNPGMASYAPTAGITRSGSSGSYHYDVVAGSGNKPITYVSWFDAARFCNWMHNGQQTGAGAALTAETGAYTLNGTTSGIITKNVGATVYIPSEDEWYKAAYYDPNKGGAGVGGYWLYPTHSDDEPSNDLVGPDFGNNANFYQNGYTVGAPGYLTDVGDFENSASYYGTFDQGGNIWEWNDAVIDVGAGPFRGLRGGDYWDDATSMRSSHRTQNPPDMDTGGIRLVAVPETGSASIIALAALLLGWVRCR